MRAALTLALMLVACERASAPLPHAHIGWGPSKVGDRTAIVGRIEMRGVIQGTEVHTETTSSSTSEILTMNGETPTRTRVRILQEATVANGVQQPALSTGEYIIDRTSTPTTVTKTGSVATEYEQLRLGQKPKPNTKTFVTREFTLGERYLPTAQEREALGWPSAEMELTVLALVEGQILFHARLDAPIEKGPTAKCVGLLELSQTSYWHACRGELILDEKPLGPMSIFFAARMNP